MVIRNGMVEQVWKVNYKKNGFSYSIFIRGTEKEMWEYTESEMGYTGSYSALTSAELKAAETLRMPIYLASRC